MIIALAGRRIDAADAEVARFPLIQVDSVTEKLKALFISLKPNALVCSAACGADLLALRVAGELAINRSIVLPFDPHLFKTTSVVDRPGDWGDLYDKILEETSREEKIQVLDYPKDDDETYRRANIDILERAKMLGDKYDSKQLVAVIVWDGKPKDNNDTTEHFRKEASGRGFEIKEINTLNN